MSQLKSLSPHDYHIGWICPLDFELAAAKASLDELHHGVHNQHPNDHNTYTLGQLWGHNIAIASLPAGHTEITPVATIAKDMSRTFKSLRFWLIIGIGGAIPDIEQGLDIRLGDVVVSQSSELKAGLFQYDLGESQHTASFLRLGTIPPPPKVLLTAITTMKSSHMLEDNRIQDFHSQMIQKYPRLEKVGFGRPDVPDKLFNSTYVHSTAVNCDMCAKAEEVVRPARDPHPSVHYGTIASGNRAIKDPALRDAIKNEGAICFDTEATGMLDSRCLVIRGIADYADSHGNSCWQKYAAAMAVCFAKELLSVISVQQVQAEKPIRVTDAIPKESPTNIPLDENSPYQRSQEDKRLSDEEAKCHLCFKTSTYEVHKNINSVRVPDTGRWAFENPKFSQWLKSERDDLLWVCADPGSGKSVLSRALVDEELPKDVSVCYFFFKDNGVQRSLKTALCALIYQLFDKQRQLIYNAIPTWQRNGEQVELEVEELWRLFIKATSDDKCRSSVVVVLDALDECDQTSRELLLELLKEFYSDAFSADPRKHTLKFLVTSRYSSEIEVGCEEGDASAPVINLSDPDESNTIRQEINHVIRLQVENVGYKLRLGDSMKADIEHRLLEIENRTYLWLYLVMDDIEDMYRNSKLSHSEAVDTIPVTIADAYGKLWDKIKAKNHAKAMVIFQIILGALRALTTRELAIAISLAMSPNHTNFKSLQVDEAWVDRNLVSECGLFLSVKDSKVSLIHQTAKGFLIRNLQEEMIKTGLTDCLSPAGNEELLARICVDYLSLYDFQEPTNWHSPTRGLFSRNLQRLRFEGHVDSKLADNKHGIQGFLAYAAEHWAAHFRVSLPSWETLKDKDSLFQKAYQLHKENANIYSLWVPIFWMSRGAGWSYRYRNPKSLHVAATSGLEPVVRLLLEEDKSQLQMLQTETDPSLTMAAIQGHTNLVELLLDKGALIDARGGDTLREAAAHGHKAIVELLLKRGADIRAKDGDILGAATAHGHGQIVQLLLDNGADINAREGYALQEASRYGHKHMVEFLIHMGADVNAGGARQNVLVVALENGHKDIAELLLSKNPVAAVAAGATIGIAAKLGDKSVVEMLLKHGANVNASRGQALIEASTRGHKHIVHLLLEHGADVNAGDGFALRKAATSGYHDIVKLLLQHGADANIGKGDALISASKNGHSRSVQILLQYGADSNLRDGLALVEASVNGHDHIVELLLEKSEGQDIDVSQALWEAVKKNKQHAVELLLEWTVDIRVEGAKILEYASRYGYIGIVAVLLDMGVDINSCDALEFAATMGHNPIVELLLDRGVDVNAKDGEALHLASQNLRTQTVQLLIERGANVNARDGEALLQASLYGSVDLIKLLLDKGADVNARDGEALQEASLLGNVEVVKLLLKRGADINAQDGGALRKASLYGHVDIVQLLLEMGADVNARNGEALAEASLLGCVDVVKLLLQQGADVHINALDAASDPEIAELLLENVPEID